jgi:two-component system response regulator PhcR
MTPSPVAARTVLFVDDEPAACKWFARALQPDCEVLTAHGVAEALAVLLREGARVEVLVTDYRMPQRDGLELLQRARQDWPHIVRLLVSAYADKEVTQAAVNRGHVFRLLDKPLDLDTARAALHDAFAYHDQRARQRLQNARAAAAMAQTLGFLAHELNTPLSVVALSAAAVRERLPRTADGAGATALAEAAAALERIERSTAYCRDLLHGFVRAARTESYAALTTDFTAAQLVARLLEDFPFVGAQRDWVELSARSDFALPSQPELLLLAAATLTQNALHFLADRPAPRLIIDYAAGEPAGAAGQIRFADNGPGIEPALLPRLSRERLSTRAGQGGNGMGLVFARRVMESLGGRLTIESAPGSGTTVSLQFGTQEGAQR